jgi:hypothetical protein
MEFGPSYLKLKEGPVNCEIKGSQLDLYAALEKGSDFKIGTPVEAFGYTHFNNNDWYVAVLTMKAL